MKKLTNEEFLCRINRLNPTYTILSEYVNIDTKVHCHCNIHNINFDASPYNLFNGKCGCELCRREKIGKKNRRTKDDFIKKMKDVNCNISILGEYVNCKKKIECECLLHNQIFYATPDHLIQGETGCEECIRIKNHNAGLKPHDVFVNELEKINPDIEVIGRYDGSKSRVTVQCLKCHTTWSPQASSLVSGFGCPVCSASKGEKRIRLFFEDNGISFKSQKTFDKLLGVGGGKLSYDFYIPSYNLLIEYQGEFHDGTASIQTEEELVIQKEHDARKRYYAQRNGIKLLEIWYYDYDKIEQILKHELDNLKTL